MRDLPPPRRGQVAHAGGLASLRDVADPSEWCEQCGEPTGARRLASDDVVPPEPGPPPHDRNCAERAALEPPRYCGRCRRRMVVQVLPLGWSARCTQHGTRTG